MNYCTPVVAFSVIFIDIVWVSALRLRVRACVDDNLLQGTGAG